MGKMGGKFERVPVGEERLDCAFCFLSVFYRRSPFFSFFPLGWDSGTLMYCTKKVCHVPSRHHDSLL